MRVNLLPPEIRARQIVRRQAILVGVVGGLILMALGGFFVLQQLRLNAVRDQVAVQELRNQQLRQEIAELQRFDELQREADESRTLLATLMADEVLWSGVLRDISLVIPGEAWLTGLTGAVENRTVHRPGPMAR
jgi:Tfp pilus assembly protein PilN